MPVKESYADNLTMRLFSKKSLLCLLWSLCSILSVHTQTNCAQWETIGTTDLSLGREEDPSLAIDGNNVKYVAYSDGVNGSKATVMKYNGMDWELVGQAGFSAGNISSQSLAIDGNNVPYVAYEDSFNDQKATVMKFNGSNWEVVGAVGFSDGSSKFISLAIDGNNVPYVAYQDGANDTKTTVMKFNGSSWEVLGTKGFSFAESAYQSLAIDNNNVPYVAYQDSPEGFNPNSSTVKKFNGSTWELVGVRSFVAGGVTAFQSLAIDNNNIPYLAYSEIFNNGKGTVQKFVGISPEFPTGWVWVGEGDVYFSDGEARFLNLAINTQNELYVAYFDLANGFKTTVMKFDGIWSTVGVSGFSPNVAFHQSLAIDNNDQPFVAFQDDSNLRTIVMTLDPQVHAVGGNDAYIDIDWSLNVNTCLTDNGSPYPNSVYVQLLGDGEELFGKILTDIDVRNTTFDHVYRHHVGPDKTVNYVLNVFNVGLGQLLYQHEFSEFTLPYQGFESFLASNPLPIDSIELTWQSNSYLADEFRIYRANELLTIIDATQAVGSNYRYKDAVNNGESYDYCIEIYSQTLATAYPQICDMGSTRAIDFTASDGTFGDKVVLNWEDVSDVANMLQIWGNESLIQTIPSSGTSYELSGVNIIPGDTINYELRLLNNSKILTSDYDKGYITANGKINGKVTTKIDDFPVQGATITLSGTVNGNPISTSMTSSASGYYEFDAIFYGTQTDFTVSISKDGKTFLLPSVEATLNLLNPIAEINFQQEESYEEGNAILSIDNIKIDTLATQNALSFKVDFSASNFPTFLNIRRGTEVLVTAAANNDANPFEFIDQTGVPEQLYTYEITLFTLQNDQLSKASQTVTARFPSVATAANLIATSESTNGLIRLNWQNPTTNVTGVKIFRHSAEGKEELATLDPATTEFKDWTGVADRSYTYEVSSFKTIEGVDYDASSLASMSITYPALPAVINPMAALGADRVHLAWDAAAILHPDYNYSGFLIRRSDGDSTIIYKGFPTVFTDFTGIPEMNYDYQVFTFKQLPDCMVTSIAEEVNQTFPSVSPPSNLQWGNPSYSISLQWNRPNDFENIDGYGIFRQNELIDSVASDVDKITVAAYHTLDKLYEVKSYRIIKGQHYYSSPIDRLTSPTFTTNSLIDITSFNASEIYPKKVELTWEYPSFVLANFQILRDGILLDTVGVGESTFYDLTAQPGRTYFYQIYAYTGEKENPDNESKYKGDNGKRLTGKRVSGMVTSAINKQGIKGTRIIVEGLNFKLTYTDATGYYQVDDVQIGTNVRVRATAANANFETDLKTITADGSTEYVVNFENNFEPPLLDTVSMASVSHFEVVGLPCENGARLKWSNTNNNYDGFEIFRGLKPIALIKKGQPMIYTDTLGSPGVFQTYSIRTYTDTKTGRDYSENNTAYIFIPIIQPAAALYATASLVANELSLFWSHSCEEGIHYEILRDRELIGLVEAGKLLQFIDDTGVPGQLYTYTITAKKVRAGTIYSAAPIHLQLSYPAIKKVQNLSASTPLSIVALKKDGAEANYPLNYVGLNWSYSDDNCKGFIIYRDAELIANLPCGVHNYQDFEGTPNGQHTYKVIAVLEREGVEFQSLPVQVSANFPDLSTPYYFHAVFGFNKSVIRFRYLSDAVDGFYVYRSTTSNIVIGDIIATLKEDYVLNQTITYDDYNFLPQTNYYYGVAAFSKREGITYTSSITSDAL